MHFSLLAIANAYQELTGEKMPGNLPYDQAGRDLVARFGHDKAIETLRRHQEEITKEFGAPKITLGRK